MDDPIAQSSSSSSPIDIRVDVEHPAPQPAQPPPPAQAAPPPPQPIQAPLQLDDPPNPPPQGLGLEWHWLLKLLGFLVVLLALILTLILVLPKHKRDKTLEDQCTSHYFVSKEETADFQHIQEAVDSVASYNPAKTCILIRAGIYEETIKIGPEKTNLILIGEEVGSTKIISNASSSDEVRGDRTPATLWIWGDGFLAQDLTILNSATDGVAVENWGYYSVFFRCNLQGKNNTLHLLNGPKQFYRQCSFYGSTFLISGDAHSYFQKCKFMSESIEEHEIVLLGQSGQLGRAESGFLFDHCEFRSNNTREKVSLGSGTGAASIVVMRSFLDASITGYATDSFREDTTFFAILENMGPGATSVATPSYIHILKEEEAQSKFSLRSFLNDDQWIPKEVAYDLDLAR